MQKILLGLAVIDRPKTTDKCIQNIVNSGCRDRLTIVAIDNNSNDETKEVLKKHSKDLDLVITNEFNVGVCFSTNQYLALREPGQYCMKVDVDAHILTPDWLDIMLDVFEKGYDLDWIRLKPFHLGFIMGRRPSFWTDVGRLAYYRNPNKTKVATLGLYPLEFIQTDGIIWPWVMFHPTVLDIIGYMNEAVNCDDMDFGPRAGSSKFIGCYVPDVVISQNAHAIGHPEYEEQHHPQYNAYRQCWALHMGSYWHETYYTKYVNFEHVYCGTRFLLGSINDPAYQKMSDINWEFMKNYSEKDKNASTE